MLIITKMAYQLTGSFNPEHGSLKIYLTADMIDIDLKSRTLKGIHVDGKEYRSKDRKCILWEAEVRLYSEIKSIMADYLKREKFRSLENIKPHQCTKKFHKRREI